MPEHTKEERLGDPKARSEITAPDATSGALAIVKQAFRDGIAVGKQQPGVDSGECWTTQRKHFASALSRAAAAAPAGGVTELPDDIRVPLDSLHADALYLTSRVAQGTMSAVRLSQVIRERIDAAKAALAGAAQGAEPDAWRFQWRNGDVGFMDAGETADRLRKGVVGEDGTVILNPDSGRTNWKPLVYAASPQPPTGTSKEGAADHGR